MFVYCSAYGRNKRVHKAMEQKDEQNANVILTVTRMDTNIK